MVQKSTAKHTQRRTLVPLPGTENKGVDAPQMACAWMKAREKEREERKKEKRKREKRERERQRQRETERETETERGRGRDRETDTERLEDAPAWKVLWQTLQTLTS